MKVLGLDPGSTESGWVLLDGPPPRRPEAFNVSPNTEILARISAGEFDRLVMESVPAVYGRSALPALCDTIRWEGRFLERAAASVEKQILPYLVSRQQVKAWLLGNASGRDADVRAELVHRYGDGNAIGKRATRGPLYGVSSHIWPALAVALWGLDHP